MISKTCVASLIIALAILVFYPISSPYPSTMTDPEKAIAAILITGFLGVIAAIKETRK